ncbi:MAG: bifunctional aspartate kinase/diaminopimelate decarboxylase [Legionellaceae bacterium]|nr:bifunctional aspartate kinase/diaminopimelate decarboxylase [Legionellaceae bacterium]
MNCIITKFGGTSVSSRAMWDNIYTITQEHVQSKKIPIIVCSALTKISDTLEQAIQAAMVQQHEAIVQDIRDKYYSLAHSLEVSPTLIDPELRQLEQWLTGIALLQQTPAKTQASIMSLGEIMMTRLGHAFLQQQGMNCVWLDAREMLCSTPVPFRAESHDYLQARCKSDANPALRAQLLSQPVDAYITQGFFARNPEGETVLLGRGGSDTSAGLLAAIVEAEACEIWTDVPGIYTSNPRYIPEARLLKQLSYDEAQEIATMGGKVLHPNCIPPVRDANIPLYVKCTAFPFHTGTKISNETDEHAPPIKSIQVKSSITVISMDTQTMWQQVGFLSDIFAVFKRHGFSVDLLSSSEFNVTISLDSHGKPYTRSALDALMTELNQCSRARIIEPCSAVSLVGHRIRTVLPDLGPTLELFDNQQMYMMSLASNDLNLTFIVDEAKANKLSQQLHALLIENHTEHLYHSKSWREEFGAPVEKMGSWWELKKDTLLCIADQHSPCYVYDKATIEERCQQLKTLKAIDQLYYAVKANPFPDLLTTIEAQGVGFECVSIHELELIFELFPNIDTNRLLFTPNFAPHAEYAWAFRQNIPCTIDSLYPLEQWGSLLAGQRIYLRLDPGVGAGHHKHVCTGGNESKFGITQEDIPKVLSLIKQHGIFVIGLHAHSGSGINDVSLWQETALMLGTLAQQFPDVQHLNLGGGFGVPEKPGQQVLDLPSLDEALAAAKSQYPHLRFIIEPGRFLVSEGGVLLAKVTQIKGKGKVSFVGIETGMNSLIRPPLYGAYHEIVNLSRLHEEKTMLTHIVGPICESADTLGYNRRLPQTQEGDILLIANTGAYGHCMSSHYNLRPPAQELLLD